MLSNRCERAWLALAVSAASTSWLAVPVAQARPQALVPANIETSQLRPLSAWEIGVPEPGAIALPASLWAGSSTASLTEALAQTPAEFASPAARRVALGALLSASAPSEAGSFKALLERYEAIGRLGAANALADMVRLSSQARNEPNLAVFAAQAELALQRPALACQRTREAPPSLPSLLKLRAFCLAIAGDALGASVALDVARNANAGDKFFYAALPLLNAPGNGPLARYDSTLNAAISLGANLRPPPQPLADASNLALIHLASSALAKPPLRAQALFSVLARALMEPAAARAAALDCLKAWPAGKAAPALPAWLRLLREVEAEASPAMRAAKIADALARASSPAERLALARLFLPEILAGPQSGPVPANGLRLARSALVLGEMVAAQRWRAALGSETSASSLASLDAALAIASGGDAVAAARQRLGASAGDVNRAARDVGFLGMLSPLPPDLLPLAPLASAASGSGDSPAMAALLASADRLAMGETALRAATLLKGGTSALDNASLARLVQALKKTGQEPAARAILVEAILG